MGRGNSDVIYFLEQHEQEIINCCRKGMSNNEVRELLKTKYDRYIYNNLKFKILINYNLERSRMNTHDRLVLLIFSLHYFF